MVAQPTFNPYIQTNATGSFNIDANGGVQGTAMDDPATRYRMRGVVLNTTETLPMWGGVGIYEDVASSLTPNQTLGGYAGRATSVTAQAAKQLTGFSVFDQNYSAVQSPQSPVPLVGTGATFNIYPLGSKARVWVAADPALISLRGGINTALVSWDYVAQKLVAYTAAYVANPITGATWANTSGGQITYTVTNDLSAVLAAGSTIDVSGVVSTGATTDGYNGNYVVVSVGATTIVVTAPRAASPGTYSSGGSVAAGGGALPCNVLQINSTNSMTVSYDATTGFATWNRSGSAALIQI